MSSAIAQSSILTITGGDGQQHNLPPGTSLTSISSANNSNGQQQLPTVKQERHDEAEIAELAAKMLEQQKAALARQAQQQQQQQLSRQMTAALASPTLHGTNQANILNYLTRTSKPINGVATTNSSATATSAANTASQQNGHQSQNGNGTSTNGKDSEQKPCDEESLKGHFGWTTFGKVFIPFLLRSSEKYCAVRIIEMKLLGKHLSSLHPDIYSSCTYVRSYFITEAESRLLNEINHKHCDGQFGREFFTCKDLVVRLSDATKFYQFLDICYRKLVSGNKSPSDKCGFIRINKESVVPYTVRNGEQVVPLFYFEGETDNLRQKADLLSGWDLAYLKFCCKVQGIRNELFSSESVAVISLTDIKSYFPSGTEFEDYWPSKVVDSNLLLAQKSGNSVNWTRQPVGPPPKVVTPNQIINKQQQQQQQHNSLQQQQLAVKRNAIAATAFQAAANMPSTNALARHAAMSQNNLTAAVQALANGWNLNSALLSQAQLSQAQATQLLQAAQQQQQSRAGYAANRNQTMQSLLNRQNYNYTNGMQQMSQQQQQQPPPLVRSQSQTHMSNYSTTSNQAVTLKRSISSSNNNNNSFFPPSSPSLPTPFITPNPSPDQNITNLLLQSQQFSNNNYLSNSNYSSRNYQNQQNFQNSSQKLNAIPSLIPMNNMNKLNASNDSSGGSSSCSGRNDANNNNNNNNNSSTRFQQQNLTSDEEVLLRNNNLDDLVRKVLLNPAMSTYITKNCYPGQNSSSTSTISSPTPVITKLNSSPSLLPSPQSLPPPSPLSYNISPHQYSQSYSTPPQSLNQSQQSNMNFPRQKSVICSPTASTIASTLLSPQSHQRHPELLLPQDQFYNQNLINYNKNNFNYNDSNSSSSCNDSKNIFNNNKNNNYQTTKPHNMEVIDLSLSPSRRSPAAAALLQQQAQQQAAAAAAAQQQQRYSAMQQRQQVNALAMASNAANAMQQHLRNAANMQSQQDQHNSIRAIPEIPSGGVQIPPYKMQKVLVFDNTMIPCINMTAYNDGDMLMSLVDFRDHFCPNIPLDRCKNYLETLGVEMYKANRRQIQTLLEYGKQHSENAPLILVRDIIKYMPQIRYMMRGNNQEQPPSKRSRIS